MSRKLKSRVKQNENVYQHTKFKYKYVKAPRKDVMDISSIVFKQRLSRHTNMHRHTYTT